MNSRWKATLRKSVRNMLDIERDTFKFQIDLQE